jgi:hypothetical protein
MRLELRKIILGFIGQVDSAPLDIAEYPRIEGHLPMNQKTTKILFGGFIKSVENILQYHF